MVKTWRCSTQDSAICLRESDIGQLQRSAWKAGIEPVEIDVDYEGAVHSRKFFRIVLKGMDGLCDVVTGSFYVPSKLQCATSTRLTAGILQLVPMVEKVDLTKAEEKAFAKLFKGQELEAA